MTHAASVSFDTMHRGKPAIASIEESAHPARAMQQMGPVVNGIVFYEGRFESRSEAEAAIRGVIAGWCKIRWAEAEIAN